ncbi:MAG: porin family protein [Rubrivivax sp.]|nr:porin family protein [Rubrivivax sp.]
MSKIHFVAAAALLALVGTAQAQGAKTDGGYFSVGGGRSSFDIDCTGTTACDKSGSAVRVSGGYRKGGFGYEAVILRFGTTKATVPVAGFGNVVAELKTEMVGGGVALMAPFSNNLEGMVRLGVASVKTSGGGSVNNVRVDIGSERKAKLYAGLGISYAFTPTVNVQANWDSTQATFAGDDGNVSAFTVSVGFKF